MSKNTKEILIDARDSAIERGLSAGELVGTRADGTRCYCALGHIALAAGHEVVSIEDDGEHVRFAFAGIDDSYDALDAMDAVQVLAATIKQDDPTIPRNRHATNTIYTVNDAAVKQKGGPEQIIGYFNKAIASLD